MKQIVVESDMRFVVDDAQVFRVEENAYLQKSQNIMLCEFVAWNETNQVTLVEAKISSPKPNNGCEDYKKTLPYFVDCVQHKFENSFHTFVAARVGRFAMDSKVLLPATVSSVVIGESDITFYLVIKNHKTDWLPCISDMLKKQLHPFLTCWNIRDSSVKVLNEDIARHKGLIE